MIVWGGAGEDQRFEIRREIQSDYKQLDTVRTRPMHLTNEGVTPRYGPARK